MFALFFTADGTAATSPPLVPHGGLFLTDERARGLPWTPQKLFWGGGRAKEPRAHAGPRTRARAGARA